MNERYQQIKELFQAALESTVDERMALLDGACQADPALRAEVDELLAAHEQTSYLDAVALLHEATPLPAAEPMLGMRLGPYRILREIGHGGMGTVYLAGRDDDQFKKQVAIKLLRGGPFQQVMLSDLIVRRFRQERQILASLEHPNIARLLDGGATKEGLPYLVLEYIEGQALDYYCDWQLLSLIERLRLFRTVCAAVHYAHQNLVVHRDLKPSNILITADGTPKLLDFGIAKILNPETHHQMHDQTIDQTMSSVRLMTPAYASPEQVRGETITTASDVYALGMVLYELLTGHRPYQLSTNSLHETSRIICEVEPPKPSAMVTRVEVITGSDGSEKTTITPGEVSRTRKEPPEKLSRRLAGDLDNIVMMALRKEPQRRYASVEQFSEDIQRYLDGLPVRASSDTFTYRSAKFVRRHKAGVAAAALVSLSLIAGIITTAWQARVARTERARAEQRFNDVRKLARAVVFDYHDAVADLPGSTPVRQRMVKDALGYLDSLAHEVSSDRDLQRELATAYSKIGDIQGNSYVANLGDAQGALASYRKALAIREALAVAAPNDMEIQQELARIHELLGDVLWDSSDLNQTQVNYKKSQSLLESLSAATPGNIAVKRQLAQVYGKIGELKGSPFAPNLGDPVGGIEFYRKDLALLDAVFIADSSNANRRSLLICHRGLSILLTFVGDLASAEQHARIALEQARTLTELTPESTEARRDFGICQVTLADLLLERGSSNEALEYYKQALATRQVQLKADPTNNRARRDVMVTHRNIGNALIEMEDLPGALAHLYQALALAEANLAAEPNNKLARNDTAGCHYDIGWTLEKSGALATALQSLHRAMALHQKLAEDDPGSSKTKLDLANDHESIADALLKEHDAAGALASYRQAADLIEGYLSGNPTYEEAREKLATICFKLGQTTGLIASAKSPASQRLENWNSARQWYQRSLDLFLAQKNKGVLKSDHAGKPDEIRRQIAKCDGVLAKLNSRAASLTK